MKKAGFIFILLGLTLFSSAQDTTVVQTRSLDSITVLSIINQHIIRPLPAVQGTFLFAGKKTEMIDMTNAPADITNKTGRQLFSKIPGVFVYDMDGSGNQINIAARGLDPHRGWEFNLRKDGIIINSDMYGYPASHYSMPMESIARVEMVRGTGSLQYGAQFGGMISYISKQGDTTRPFSFESVNTIGSFNLLSTYNAIGGKTGKLRYYAYMQKKTRGGYRDNEHTDSEAEAVIVTYQPFSNLTIRAEWARSKYLYRIPGPLTDSMFHADPRQATRSRNYFSPDINVPSLTVSWNISSQTKLELTGSAVIGKRNSVLFDKPTNIRDTINTVTMAYNNRQVDIDHFNSRTIELRMLHEYALGKQVSAISAGLQYMNNDLHRTQLGKGTTGSDYDLTLVEPAWGRDLHFKTHNIALFAENKFQLYNNLSVSMGARVESGQTDLSGTINYYPENKIPVSIAHRFPLFGINVSYKPNNSIEFYGGWSQAYRPMLFKDLIPTSTFEKVDSNIRDSKGYNAELGFRGAWKFLRWDVNAFLLRYNNRFGTLAETDNTGTFYTLRTNIGNSFTRGIEILLQGNWMIAGKIWLSAFTSTAVTHARYKEAMVKSGNLNITVTGKKVESVPDLITRNGITLRYKKISFSALYSYTSQTYADALNTEAPLKTTGAVGLVPGYGLLDMAAAIRISRNLELKMTLNNVTNKQYFTKRPVFYPGPGVWPSDGRNCSASFIIRL